MNFVHLIEGFCRFTITIEVYRRYHLFLNDLALLSDRAGREDEGDLYRAAHDVVMDINNNANDMMDVGRVEKFDGDITSQGLLLHRGTVMCRTNSTKKKQVERKSIRKLSHKSQEDLKCHLFLFQKSLVVCELTPRSDFRVIFVD